MFSYYSNRKENTVVFIRIFIVVLVSFLGF